MSKKKETEGFLRKILQFFKPYDGPRCGQCVHHRLTYTVPRTISDFGFVTTTRMVSSYCFHKKAGVWKDKKHKACGNYCDK
jgi:hypothetical protein